MSYTLILSNGEVLQGVERNGQTWQTKQEVTEETFRGGLRSVKVEGPEPEEGIEDLRGIYERQRLDALYSNGDWRSFVLTGISAEEQEKIQLRADVDYALMLGGASF